MTTDQQIEQIIADCRFTTSPEQEDRVLQDAGKVLQKRTATSSAPFSYRRIGLRLAVVASLAAVILVALLLRESPHMVAWADVQKKVAEQEWILVRGKANDGETFESWTSIPLKIDALKSGDYISFEDYKHGLREVYDPAKRVVTRAYLDDQDWKEKHSMLEMFNVIAKGDDSVQIKSPSPQVKIVSQNSRKIERDGKPWIEFELQLREQKHTVRMIFLIEPGSHLIRSMQLINGEERMTATFSYPETGPKSIYNLGVPKSAKLIDDTPGQDIVSIVEGVKTSAMNFDPYIAINVMQEADAPWYVGTPQKVWANGSKKRMEYGLVDPSKNNFQKPEASADRKQWWFQRWGQLWHVVVEVCDGDTDYSNQAQPETWTKVVKPHPIAWDPDDWPAPQWNSHLNLSRWPSAAPLFIAYHMNIKSAVFPDVTAKLDQSPAEGPDGTVLLTLSRDDPRFKDVERFWIDPKRSYIVMKYELSSQHEDGTSQMIVTVKELKQSPRGLWYPTLVSHRNIGKFNGKVSDTENITRHYLDFDTEFPKGVFETNSLKTGSTNASDREPQKTTAFPFPASGLQPIPDRDTPEIESAGDSIPSDEILALIDNIRTSAEKFGPYTAINVLQGAEAAWYVGTPSKVWADGIKARKETGFVDPNRDTFQRPDPDTDQKQWWFDRWGQLWHTIGHVSDGKKEYHNTAVPEGWTGMGVPFPPLTYPPEDWPAPEWDSSIPFQDRPMPTSSPLSDAYDTHINLRRIKRSAKPTLETNPAAGPEGTVLLTLRFNTETKREFTQRFWIDPRRSYIVIQYEHLSGETPTVTNRRVIEELAKSPSGIWYPTRVRHKYFVEQDGKKTVIEFTTRHYLDFNTRFPEGVFETKPLPEAE